MPFRIALSGLNASTADLRVISNNIANASTTGFKKSRAEFADIYAASNLGVSSNAIGSGVKVAAVAQQFTQGNIGFTDNNLDLAISGQGFFRLNDNGVSVYSRAGSFSVDRAGFVVNNQNQRLTAYQADNLGNITGALGDLWLDTSDIAPSATTLINAGLNLDASAAVPLGAFNPTLASTYNSSTSLTIYDSLGGSQLATMYYRKTGVPNEWQTWTYVNGVQVGGPDLLTFSNVGQLSQVNGVAVPPAQVNIPAFNLGNGSANIVMNIDYTNISQYGSPFSVNSLVQDGYATGRLNGVDISDTGVVQARFTNGRTRTLGQVALVNFSNPQGLRQLGDTSWAETFDSGAALVGAPSTGSLGLVQSGALEGSNVDLTEQLVNMITAQRNFQANAQVITTADAITQSIINIRR